MIKKLPFFLILVFCLFFFPKTVEACSWDSRFRTCIGECNPGYQCQGGMSGCSCQPVSGPTTIPCSSNGSTCTNHSQCCSGYCADGICANLPPTSTPKPPTPTSPPCDVDGNNTCNNPNPDCQSQCKPCDQGYTGPRKKNGDCYTSTDCRDDGLGPCYVYDDLPDPVNCGYCSASATPTSGPTPTPFCQIYTCYDMNTPQCPYTYFGGCPGGIGNCDNCGGQDCGTCDDHSPPGTTPVPTSLPGCVESCVNPNVSPCITTTCSGDTCQGNCGQYCYGTMYCPLTTLTAFQIRRGSDWFYTDRNGRLLLDNPET